MSERRANQFDRRSGNDRRNVYRVGYFLRGGIEKRNVIDRRNYIERRKDWDYVENCCSIKLEDISKNSSISTLLRDG